MKTFVIGFGAGLLAGMVISLGRRSGNSGISGKRPSESTHASFHPKRTHHEQPGSQRDPEERAVSAEEKQELREKMLDKTLADSFPTSDPPSSIPDPSEDDSLTA